METNAQLDLAFDFIQLTNKNIFLTGKAGTGKTTFLHRVQAEVIKRNVVVAPTGVAAINARGMTIHSFFQMPFGPFLPDVKTDLSRQRKFSKKKINLIKSLDLLIIDEISMVRADLLDGIDDVLRRYKNPTEPFGGVQLLMIGDLHQLPPVVKQAEWDLLREYYQTPYFFGSQALQKTNPITIQLTHIFRQSDEDFIHLLNRVRNNQIDNSILEKLNSRYLPNFQPANDEPYITLTSHNATAFKINNEKLRELPGQSYFFKAKVDGDFPENAYPNKEELEFKVGAQVLFIKNETGVEERRYYNGKIGQITKINEDGIYVKCPEDEDTIHVTAVDWENVKFKLNERSKEVEENVVGTFTQFPLKLAWAITIHKSQGLTFERAIIDAQAAFAHGQVYVALSRCKTFEGIVLRSEIKNSSVKTDGVVQNYSRTAAANAPDEKQLHAYKIAYQQYLIRELFDFENIKKITQRVHRVFSENENLLTTEATEQVKEWTNQIRTEVFDVSEKFQNQINQLFNAAELPEKQTHLQERIKKASVYFLEKVETRNAELKRIPILTENQKILKIVNDNIKSLQKELYIKRRCMTVAQKGFVAARYLKLKVDAELDFEKQKSSVKSKSNSKQDISEITPHPELYNRIKYWRDVTAAEMEVPLYRVINLKSIMEATKILPTDKKTLLHVHGFGKKSVEQFGEALLNIVETYCKERNLPTNLLTIAPRKKRIPKRSETKEKSFEFFKEGKTINEIAQIRGLARTTIEGHLGYFVGTGELDIYRIIDEQKVETIQKTLTQYPDAPTSDIKAKLGDNFSYGDIGTVKRYLAYEESKTEDGTVK